MTLLTRLYEPAVRCKLSLQSGNDWRDTLHPACAAAISFSGLVPSCSQSAS
jgi:hypothetical protein